MSSSHPPPPALKNPKAAHYAASLGAALTRGAWAESNPGQAPNGTPLGWGELVRKWGKHTGGNTSLVHHLRDVSLLHLSAAAHHVAASGYLVTDGNDLHDSTRSGMNGTMDTTFDSSASSGDAVSNDTAASGSASSFVHIPRPHIGLHHHTHSVEATGGTAVTQPSGMTSASTVRGASTTVPAPSYARATFLGAGEMDGDDGSESTAWGAGSAWERILDPSRADEVREGVRALEALSPSSLRAPEALSSTLILAYHHHAAGSHNAAIAAYERFDWGSPVTSGVVDGDAGVVERIRAKTLQGASYEMSSKPDPTKALACYLAAVALLDKLSSSPLIIPQYLSLRTASAPSFDLHREAHRHVSTALTRAAIIAARGPDPNVTLRALRTYHALAPSWPAVFRPHQRQRMLFLYLNALLSSYPGAGAPAPDPYLLTRGESTRSARVTWRAEVVEAFKIGQRLLSDSTSFPRAGSVNRTVIAFAERVASFADRVPALASDAIAVLWWATTLTFHSHAILRHLTRLLAANRDTIEAKRTFQLYVKLVLKARQTQHPDLALNLERQLTEDATSVTNEKEEVAVNGKVGGDAADGDTIGENPGELGETEIDTDDDFVSSLLVGANLLLVDLHDPTEAWRYACLAGEVVKARPGLGSHVLARVEECKGIVRMALSTNSADPDHRPAYQAEAINHLVASTTLDPLSPSAFYHLAFCQAEARQIAAATESIRTALELDSSNVHAWHLLTLLLTAQGDWDDALKAGDTGVAVWEAEDEIATADEADMAPVLEGDFAELSLSATPVPAVLPLLLLSSGELAPVPGATRPRALKDKRLEAVIQLRMTLGVVAEKLQGPDAGMVRQQENFTFFSSRVDTYRKSRAARSTSRAPSMRSTMGSSTDLGGSYISVAPERERIIVSTTAGSSAAEISSPLEMGSPIGGTSSAALVPPILTTTASSSPGNSTDQSADEADAEGGSQKPSLPSSRTGSALGRVSSVRSYMRGGRDKGGRSEKRVAFGSKKQVIPKHLRLPSSVPSNGLRAASTPNLAMHRSRTASTSMTALSFASTAVQSLMRGTAPSLPPPPPVASTDPARTPTESRILSNLWLMSAATFRRWGKHEQSIVAIQEAETLDPENPAVWVQLGLYFLAHGTGLSATSEAAAAAGEAALPAFTKSLLLRPEHPPAVVGISRLYLSQGAVDLAHSLLNQLTQHKGWDVPEAWFELARVCTLQDRDARAKECLVYALELEKSRPCRSLDEAVTRWL